MKRNPVLLLAVAASLALSVPAMAHPQHHPGGWYRPRTRVFVRVLPPFYSTLWFGGIPYYYADGVYFVRDDVNRGYRETDPPDQGSGDLFIYPKNGQTESQQASDRYECHSWAASQTGFDPTQGQSNGKRDDYQRAMTACLEARGYSVK